MRCLMFWLLVIAFEPSLQSQDSVSYHPEFFAEPHLKPDNPPELGFIDPLSNNNEGKENLQIIAKHESSKGKSFVFLGFLTSAILFLIFKIFNKQLYILYRNAFSNYSLFAQLLREKRPSPFFWAFLLFIGRSFVFSVAFVLIIDHFLNPQHLSSLWIYFLLLTAFWLVKYLVSAVVGLLTEMTAEVRTYYLQHHIIYTGLAVIMLPVCFVVYFSKDPLNTIAIYALLLSLIIGVLYYISRYLRMVRSFQVDSYVLFFMYLCAFELMPLLVVAKWLSERISA